ncbi:hypothetical protein [Nocardia jiangxiensis]|uniref:Toxin-antitoxin system, toxin component n=1 Tax=Nocardia jiangxiensis TaxID=282685 RepID=A0ABW6RXF2_9NOCA|nr:hypothetical protein [Nocardia jiangxiensis]
MTNPGALQGFPQQIQQPMMAQQQPMLYCAHCGATPAAAVDVRGHRGLLVFMQFLRMPGPFCRDCGLATYRRMTVESVWLGWWGPMSMFINPLTMLFNLFAYNSIAKLAPPVPGMPGRPMDPGKPLFQRPAALGFLIPIVLTTVILTAIVISSTGSA